MDPFEQQKFNELKPKYMAFAKEDITRCNMTITAYSHDCETLIATYTSDTAHYAKRNISTSVLAEALNDAAAGLRAAEANWLEVKAAGKAAMQQWQALEEESNDIHDEVICCLDFVIEDKAQRAELEAIKEGTGNSDMIMDLGRLATLAKKVEAEIEFIGFGSEKVSRLTELYTILTELYGKVSSEKRDINLDIEMRDRAFVHCKNIEQKIKRAARLVFRKDPENLKRYRSEYKYLQNLNRK